MIEQLSPSILLGLLPLTGFAFNYAQRKWIREERDKGKCQAPFPHRCNEKEKQCQVHHILPQGYCLRVDIEDPDFPENAITLCQNAHDKIHPDVPSARHNYSQDKGSFGKLKEDRSKKLDNREVYWNTEHDRQMQVIAIRNTEESKKKNLQFPKKRG
jgi:hypothetical protein